MLRESEIRRAIADALTASGAFDSVKVGRLPEGWGLGASDLAAAVVGPGSTRRLAGWDDAPDGAAAYECEVRLTVLARTSDEELTDDAAEALWGEVVAAVDGASLVPGLTEPAGAYVGQWRYEDTPAPERRVSGTATVRYLMPWGGFERPQ